MILETSAHADDRNRALIDNYSDTMADLGVLSADDYSTLADHLGQADEAHVIVAGIEERRTRAILNAATKLAAADVTAEKIHAAAVKLSANTDEHDIALTLWREHIKAAKALLRSGFAAVPAVLTARLEAVAERGLAASDLLVGIRTAQDAIGTGRVTEWTALQDAMTEYSVIKRLTSDLRSDRLIPSAGLHDRGEQWPWDFRRQPAQVLHVGYRTTTLSDDEQRAVVVEQWRSGPWVPGFADDVTVVLSDDTTEDAA